MFSYSIDNCVFAVEVMIDVCPTASLIGLYTVAERLNEAHHLGQRHLLQYAADGR